MAHPSQDNEWLMSNMPRPIRTSNPSDAQNGPPASLESLYTSPGGMDGLRHLMPHPAAPLSNNGAGGAETNDSPTRMLLRLLGLAGAGMNGQHEHPVAHVADQTFKQAPPGVDPTDYRAGVQLQDLIAMQGEQGLHQLTGQQDLMKDSLATRTQFEAMAAHHQLQQQHQQHQQQQHQAINNVLNGQGALNGGAALGGINGLSAGLLTPGPLGGGGIPPALSSAPRTSIDGLLHLFDNGGGGLNQRPGFPGPLSAAAAPAGVPAPAFLRDAGAPVSAAAPSDFLLSSNTAVAAAVRNSEFAWPADRYSGGGEVKAERSTSPAMRGPDVAGQEVAQRAEAVEHHTPAADDNGSSWQGHARPQAAGESPVRKSSLRGDSEGTPGRGSLGAASMPNKHGRRINPRKGIPMHIMATYALLRLPEHEGNLSDMSSKIEENAYFCKQLDWTPRPGTKTYPRWKDALVGCFKPGRYPHLKKTNRKKEGLTVYALVKAAIPEKSCLKPSHLTDVDPASLPADFDMNNPLVPLRNANARAADKAAAADTTSVVTTGVQPLVAGAIAGLGDGRLLAGMDGSALLGQLGGQLGANLGLLNGLQGLQPGAEDTAALMAAVQRSNMGGR